MSRVYVALHARTACFWGNAVSNASRGSWKPPADCDHILGFRTRKPYTVKTKPSTFKNDEQLITPWKRGTLNAFIQIDLTFDAAS